MTQGRPASLVADEIRTELASQVRSSEDALLDTALEHAGLIVELADTVRAALEAAQAGRLREVDAMAERAKDWETAADRELNSARSTQLEGDSFMLQLVSVADDIADDLEEAVFHITLSPRAPATSISTLGRLVDPVTHASRELVKALGRSERIYGDAVGLKKARARRAALAVQDALKIPASAIDVEGRGAASPIASNDSEKGRALNRRIEVAFWYDDALQEQSDELQLCPEGVGSETVTRVYDSPSGGVKPILIAEGKPVITAEQLERLRSSMDEIKDRTNVRLRFIGYTNNERLERRTAVVYQDDIGLSTARARRAMDAASSPVKRKAPSKVRNCPIDLSVPPESSVSIKSNSGFNESATSCE